MTRRTKIVATIGPASAPPEVLGNLIDAGLDVVRLNCSHGKVEDHAEVVRTVRRLADERHRVVGVLADLPGPKIRLTDLGENGYDFVNDAIIEMRTGTAADRAHDDKVFTDYPTLTDDVKVGDPLILGDGDIDLVVTEVTSDHIKVRVLNGGHKQARPGLHLPAERITLPVPTDEDRHLIENLAKPENVDFVAVSFVKNAKQMQTVKDLLVGTGIRVIAKIETPEAIENLDEIVAVSDAVMVARGDLGTECPFEMVPVYQKLIIRTCLAMGTPVITATQMMESMITAATPTRAEASDVANAVCDGSDAIMLSGETAVGHDPVLVVKSMAKIALAAEEQVADYDRFARLIGPERDMNATTEALTHGAWYAMSDVHVKAVLCCTRSGSTAHAMAALRPEATLLALSTSLQTVRQESLTWGVIPLQLPETTDSDSMVIAAMKMAKESGAVSEGDEVAVLSGNQDVPGATDTLRLVTVQ